MKALASLLVLIGLLSCGLAAGNDKYGEFKKRMMPKVGQVVTVAGTLQSGKIADFIETGDGGAVYLTSNDTKKENEIGRLPIGKRLTVTGRLQYHEGQRPPRPDIAPFPEHFSIDITNAIIRVTAQER